jgi:DNA invertase Pin-like site-specific DNA recombinase
MQFLAHWARKLSWKEVAESFQTSWEKISERTKAGVAAARKCGVKFGRKPKLTRQQVAHADAARPVRSAARRGVGSQNLGTLS